MAEGKTGRAGQQDKCFDYAAMGTNEIKNKLLTQLVQVELKKGDEYVTCLPGRPETGRSKRESCSQNPQKIRGG